MLTTSTLLKFYKQREIQEALVEHARNKEIGVRYSNSFGKRPDILSYPRDVLELALRGVTSFHASEELWHNPLHLSSELSRKSLDELRKGWDLVLDIDCKIMEYSRLCAELVVRFLRYCGVESISVKFSGSKGFHVGVPFEAFPQQVGERLTKDLFPEAPKKIVLYVMENIKEELARRIMDSEDNDFSRVKERVGLPEEELLTPQRTLNISSFLEIDTVLVSSRHLYRMPYSLHEKSGLASLPLNPEEIPLFEKEMARPENVHLMPFPFLSRLVQKEDARQLLLQALDFKVKEERESEEEPRTYEGISLSAPITEQFFPSCIKKIAEGMEDGKKRGVFILMNFLGKVGWSKEEIQSFLMEWNKKNPEPLREAYLRGQLHHFTPGEKLPPNCDTDGYYKALGLSCGQCKVKNPVNYTMGRWKRHLHDKEDGLIEETAGQNKT